LKCLTKNENYVVMCRTFLQWGRLRCQKCFGDCEIKRGNYLEQTFLGPSPTLSHTVRRNCLSIGLYCVKK
jgi:hypothetical protein